jgi:hypothetical protein
MFTGRVLELERLEASMLQTRAGNPSNFMITGERGIGKSSLLNYVKALAQGKEPTLDNEVLRFLVVDTDIDQSTTQVGLAKKIELGLREGLGQGEPARKLFKEFWDIFKRVEAAGVKLRPEERTEQDETILEEFSYSLAETVKRVVTHESNQSVFNAHYDGILILIDEADNSGRALHLGSFFKLLTERLQRRGCEHLMVGLAGLPNLRDVLASSHVRLRKTINICYLKILTVPITTVLHHFRTEAMKTYRVLSPNLQPHSETSGCHWCRVFAARSSLLECLLILNEFREAIEKGDLIQEIIAHATRGSRCREDFKCFECDIE